MRRAQNTAPRSVYSRNENKLERLSSLIIINFVFRSWTQRPFFDRLLGQHESFIWGSSWSKYSWAHFPSHARSKLRLCATNHRSGYWSNLPCDWPSTAWAYSEQEAENGHWFGDELRWTAWCTSSWWMQMSYQQPSCWLFNNYTLPAKSLEYSENTMETLAFDILIYCKWLGTNHK